MWESSLSAWPGYLRGGGDDEEEERRGEGREGSGGEGRGRGGEGDMKEEHDLTQDNI